MASSIAAEILPFFMPIRRCTSTRNCFSSSSSRSISILPIYTHIHTDLNSFIFYILHIYTYVVKSMSRLENAKLLADKQICWLEKDTYLVPSQTYEKKYVVRNEGFRLVCTCPDNQYRRHHCKHIEAVKIWLDQTQAIEPKVRELVINQKCPFCQSNKFIKYGQRKTQFKQKQRYLCKSCGGRFVEGIIKGIRGDEKTVLIAMHLYYSGYSLRKIQDFFSQFHGLEITYVSLHRWIKKYQKIMIEKVRKMHPEVSPTWHADEQEVKVKGKYVYCWNLIDVFAFDLY